MRTNKKKTIVMINGCFDLFHVGHLKVIKEAKKLGDKLVIGINSDKSRIEFCGKKPIIPQEERKEILEAIKYVDEVYIYDEQTSEKLKEKIKPDITVKGNELFKKKIQSKSHKSKYIPLLKIKEEKRSTSQIINHIKSTACIHNIIAVDFDKTIWNENLQIIMNKDKVNNLYFNPTNFIVIYTARQWHNFNYIKNILDKNEVKYHAIVCEKLRADKYIDDKAENWSVEK